MFVDYPFLRNLVRVAPRTAGSDRGLWLRVRSDRALWMIMSAREQSLPIVVASVSRAPRHPRALKYGSDRASAQKGRRKDEGLNTVAEKGRACETWW
jgi:hypothetical protein